MGRPGPAALAGVVLCLAIGAQAQAGRRVRLFRSSLGCGQSFLHVGSKHLPERPQTRTAGEVLDRIRHHVYT